MFVYSGNNPVVRADDGGEFWHIIAGAAVGAAVSFVSSVVSDMIAGDQVDWGAAGISAAFGAASGAVAATGLGPVVQIAVGATLSAAEDYISQGREKGFDNVNYTQVAANAAMGAFSARTNGLSKSTAKSLNKQSKQLTKRVCKTISHNGIKAAVSEGKKAVKYYAAHTATHFYKPLIKDTVSSVKSTVRRAMLRKLASFIR